MEKFLWIIIFWIELLKKKKIVKKELSFFLLLFRFSYFCSLVKYYFLFWLRSEKFLWIIIFWIELLKKKNNEKRIEFFSSSFSFLILLFLTSQILFFILSSIGKISLNNNFLKRIEKKGKIMKKELSFFLLLFRFSYFCSSQAKYYFLF